MTNTWVFKWHKFLCVLIRALMNLIEDNRKRFPKDNYTLLIERDAMEFQAERYTFTQAEIDAMGEWVEWEHASNYDYWEFQERLS